MKLSLKEKIGYACGDVASNFYWRLFDVFLFIFFTDVFGIPAGVVGTMMLVTRIIDAVSDPVMGALADRTETKMGKFRPYLLWGILPIVGAGVMTFSTPDLSESGKIIWAYSAYILMMLAYTFINVPYGALLGVMTDDGNERTTLTSFRFIGAFSGGTLVAWLTPELVSWLGNGDDKLGWQLSLIVYGIAAAGLFVVTFYSTKERVIPAQKTPTPIVQDLKDLSANKPWLLLFALALIIMVTITLRASSGAFYFKYYVGREDLIGLFATVYMISLAIGAASTPLLSRLLNKQRLLFVLMTIVTLLSFLFYFIPRDQIALMFIIQAMIGLALGPKSPLVFSMYADTADFSEWKNGRRATAMIFSAAAFAQKLGGALAGALIGWVLAGMGYVANQQQTPDSEQGIVWLLTIVPAVFALVSLLVIRSYPLSQSKLEKIQTELRAIKSSPVS